MQNGPAVQLMSTSRPSGVIGKDHLPPCRVKRDLAPAPQVPPSGAQERATALSWRSTSARVVQPAPCQARRSVAFSEAGPARQYFGPAQASVLIPAGHATCGVPFQACPSKTYTCLSSEAMQKVSDEQLTCASK